MKAVVLYYCISTLVYFYFGTSSLYWHLFNMLSILGTMAYFMYAFINNFRADAGLKDWMVYAIVLTVCRAIYSTACPHAPIEWIYNMNKVFAGVFALWLTIKIAQKLYRGYLTSR